MSNTFTDKGTNVHFAYKAAAEAHALGWTFTPLLFEQKPSLPSDCIFHALHTPLLLCSRCGC